MGFRTKTSIIGGFAAQVGTHFRFLVDEFEMTEPTVDELLLLSLTYEGPGFAYSVWLARLDPVLGVHVIQGPAPPPGPLYTMRPHPDRIGTIVSYHGPRRTSASLPLVLVHLGLIPTPDLGWSATSATAVTRSLESAAAWLRQAHPLIAAIDDKEEFLHQAEARTAVAENADRRHALGPPPGRGPRSLEQRRRPRRR